MILRIHGVSKTYPNGVQALKDVSLTVPAGMYGLLGPNGAGKSTLMRILATLQEPDAGSVQLGEIDALKQKDEVRQTLGYLPQEFGVYPKVNAEELLEHFAILKGITARRARREMVEALLRKTNLWDVRKQKLGGYSGGMRQRFGVAVADRRPRSRRARALPEFVERAGREQRRAPFHAHCGGRERSLRQDGDHRQGGDSARSRTAGRNRRASRPDLERRNFEGSSG
jgi:ABC-type uncharacterized transport system YnjBCD ATPase subunit